MSDIELNRVRHLNQCLKYRLTNPYTEISSGLGALADTQILKNCF
jgi:hypothetical protein